MKKVHTVFSVDDSLYLYWQSKLLAWSHKRVGQPGSLTRLHSGEHVAQRPYPGKTFKASLNSYHPITGDYYPARNKAIAIREWLEEDRPREEIVLILDPDCVFLRPLPVPEKVKRGHAVAHPLPFMNLHENWALVKNHCKNPGLVAGGGTPIFIHREDLSALLPKWIQKTEELRSDTNYPEGDRWIAEMWAYSFAAAETGLTHSAQEMGNTILYDVHNQNHLPVIHYSYPITSPSQLWKWDKRNYKPWETLPEPPEDIPLAGQALFKLINSYVAAEEPPITLLS